MMLLTLCVNAFTINSTIQTGCIEFVENETFPETRGNCAGVGVPFVNDIIDNPSSDGGFAMTDSNDSCAFECVVADSLVLSCGTWYGWVVEYIDLRFPKYMIYDREQARLH